METEMVQLLSEISGTLNLIGIELAFIALIVLVK